MQDCCFSGSTVGCMFAEHALVSMYVAVLLGRPIGGLFFFVLHELCTVKLSLEQTRILMPQILLDITLQVLSFDFLPVWLDLSLV